MLVMQLYLNHCVQQQQLYLHQLAKPVLQVVVRTAAHFKSRLAAKLTVMSYPDTTQIDVHINSSAVVRAAGLKRPPPVNIPLHQLSDTCSKYRLGLQDFRCHAYLACSQLYWQNLSSMVVSTAVTHKLLWQRAHSCDQCQCQYNTIPFFVLLKSTCCLYCRGPGHVHGDNIYSVAAFAICIWAHHPFGVQLLNRVEL